MTNKILFNISTSTGTAPATTAAADLGEMMINLTDRRIYARNAAGAAVPVTKFVGDHDPALAYKAGDLVISGTQFLKCNGDIPAKALDLGDWTVISPPGGTGSAALLKAPTAVDHNTVDLTGLPTTYGLVIEPDPSQSVDLFRVGGAGPSGVRSRIDRFGIPAAGLSGNLRVISQVGHPFTTRGTPVAFDAGTYYLAVSTNPARFPVGIIEEVLDVNTFVVRYAGWTEQLQAAAFPGASITDGAVYYLSSTAGQLSLTPPASGEKIPVMFTCGATAARVIISPVQFLTLNGGALSGGLGFGSALVGSVTDLSRHVALYGTTSGLNVSTGQQVNIVANGGAGVVKVQGDLKVSKSVVLDSTTDAAVEIVTPAGAADEKTMQVRALAGGIEVKPVDDAGADLAGGVTFERDNAGLVDVLATMSKASAAMGSTSLITLQRLIDIVYPVGILIESTVATNPGTYIPGTTWAAYGAGRVTVAVGQANSINWSAGATAGTDYHTLSVSEMPSHTHYADPPGGTTGGAGNSSDAQFSANEDSDIIVAVNNSFQRIAWSDGRHSSTNTGTRTGYTLRLNWYHTHTFNTAPFYVNSNGGGAAHLNVQPSIAVYRWQRTA